MDHAPDRSSPKMCLSTAPLGPESLKARLLPFLTHRSSIISYSCVPLRRQRIRNL
ncbi:UNVERIFIED_CONTAM: hypothetical protein GTU68_015219 [Idotea baltica]|nr:hypothetical protein [Idotea baltica]